MNHDILVKIKAEYHGIRDNRACHECKTSLSENDLLSWIDQLEKNLCTLDSFTTEQLPDRKQWVEHHLSLLRDLDADKKHLTYEKLYQQLADQLDHLYQQRELNVIDGGQWYKDVYTAFEATNIGDWINLESSLYTDLHELRSEAFCVLYDLNPDGCMVDVRNSLRELHLILDQVDLTTDDVDHLRDLASKLYNFNWLFFIYNEHPIIEQEVKDLWKEMNIAYSAVMIRVKHTK